MAYASLTLTPEQQNYCTTRKELLAIIRFSRQFRHYLLGRHFTVRTDHNSLTWLMILKEPQGQLARWIEESSQFDMEIQHRLGKKHANADALSRIPGGTMFRVQPESEIAGLAMWGVSLLYSGPIELVRF